MSLPRQMQPSFTAGELAPSLYGRVDLGKYRAGLKAAKNVIVQPHGGALNRAGLEFCEEVKDSSRFTRTIEFQFSTQQNYTLEFGHLYMRVLKDGSQVLNSTTRTITGITTANPAVITSAAHGYTNGTEIYIAGVFGPTILNGRNFRVANATTNTFEIVDLYGNAVSTIGQPAYASGGTVNAIYEIATPYQDIHLADIQYAQEADVMYLTHIEYEPRKLTRTGDASWTLTIPTFAPAQAAPAAPTATASPASGSRTYRYIVSAVSANTGEESLPSPPSNIVTNDLTIAGNKNTITWTAVTGAGRYLVYKLDNGVYGYIGGTEALTFTDENITADLADTPQKGINPFVGAGNYPRCVTFFQQRLVMAATKNAPQTVYASQSANYENFGSSSPVKPDDAIVFRLRAREVNEIRAMIPARGLMLLTSSAEWIVTGANDGVITPSSIVIKNQGYRGCSKVPPLVVGNTVLFPQRSGGVIRDFSYEFAEDTYTGTDLTLLAKHLFRGKSVVSWAYAQANDSIVWCVLSDGSCVSLTYIKEHEVWAWTRHETDGVFEWVSVQREENEDVPYFVIRRTVNGQTKRYIERMRSREILTLTDSYFVDAGVYYTGPAVTSIRGLWHLDGRTVVALLNGNVVRGLTVTNGGVTFPYAATVAAVGLSYEAEIETLAMDMGAVRGIGTVQGRFKSIPSATIRVERSRGMFIGPNRNLLREWKQREDEPYDTAIALYTGDFEITLDADWNTDGTIVIRQSDPLPMNVLAVMPDVAVGA